MRFFLFFALAACSPTTPLSDAGSDASSNCTGSAPTCCNSCDDDVQRSGVCVNGAWQCQGVSADECHCGIACSLQKFPSCRTCDGGSVGHVCAFATGSGHPYTCPAGAYDRDDPDAALALCGPADAGAD